MHTEILIIGAGVGGLALAQFLHKNNFDFKIVEKKIDMYGEVITSDRNLDGYSLTLQKQGIDALKELGIFDTLEKIELFKNFGFTVSGSRLWMNDTWNENVAVPRGKLLEALRKDIDIEGFDFERYEYTEDGKINVFSTTGMVIVCDVLIGCDGYRSKVRRQLLGERDAGTIELCHNLMLINGLTRYSFGDSLKTLHPNGTYYWVDGVYRLFVKPYDSDRVMWQLSFDKSKYTGPDPVTFIYNLVEDGGWDDLPATIMKGGNNISIRSLYTSNPINIPKKGCVTLLGDAAHTMPPYKGMGANMALFDAQYLTKKMLMHTSYEKAIRSYEKMMLQEGEFYVKASVDMVKKHHSPSVKLCLWSFDNFDTGRGRWLHLTRPLENENDPRLENVVKLVIDYPVTEIPAFVFRLKNLIYLRIVRNNLTDIPDEISSLEYLKELHLRNNNISHVSHHIGFLPRLHTLRLSSNSIYYLPSTFTDLHNLKNVCLSKNLLTYLPEDFSKMTKLRTFYFRNNPIKDVPVTLVKIFMDRRVDFKC